MSLIDPPAPLSSFLPGALTKWVAFLSLFLAGLLYVLLPWLLSDSPISPALAQKLSILLPVVTLLLVGSLTILFLVLRHYHSLSPAVDTTEVDSLKQQLSEIHAAHPELIKEQLNARLWEQVKNDRARDKQT